MKRTTPPTTAPRRARYLLTLTDAEVRRIQEHARQYGMPALTYIRLQALNPLNHAA